MNFWHVEQDWAMSSNIFLVGVLTSSGLYRLSPSNSLEDEGGERADEFFLILKCLSKLSLRDHKKQWPNFIISFVYNWCLAPCTISRP